LGLGLANLCVGDETSAPERHDEGGDLYNAIGLGLGLGLGLGFGLGLGKGLGLAAACITQSETSCTLKRPQVSRQPVVA